MADPAYLAAVEKLKSGEDLAWNAPARVVAEALNDALNAVRAERDHLRAALQEIADDAEVAPMEDMLNAGKVARQALNWRPPA
jgi:hypothetical protein